MNLLKQHKPAEAEPLFRASLAIRRRQKRDDWTTYHMQSLLGAALAGQNKYAEAEPLLVQGYEGMKACAAAIPAEGKVRLTEALQRLVQLYDAWGKPEQAAVWRQKREQAKSPKRDPTP